MKALVRNPSGSPIIASYTWTWEIQCEDGQYDTNMQFDYPLPIADSTALAGYLSALKAATIAAVEAVSGPTMDPADITVMGGPVI